MGYNTFGQTSYKKAYDQHVGSNSSGTQRGREETQRNGRLNAAVDPAGGTVIRYSRPRFVLLPNGLFQLTIGTPIEYDDLLDTTGSMGSNADIALKVLPQTYTLVSKMLPGYDLQMAFSIFGDCEDNYVLNRGEYEMEAEKLVNQITLMNPEGQGAGNGGEDPHYGLFGGAYLTSAYSNKIGLKGYHFTTSDEPARYTLKVNELKRIFGDKVFEKTAENGFEFDAKHLPDTKTVIQDLLKRAHAFYFQVGSGRYNAHEFWTEMFGPERVVMLPNVHQLPQIQAAIIGLTEETLTLSDVPEFLVENKVDKADAKLIARAVSNIPIGAQAALKKKIEADHCIPQKGDLFREKTDLWPLSDEEVKKYLADKAKEDAGKDMKWL